MNKRVDFPRGETKEQTAWLQALYVHHVPSPMDGIAVPCEWMVVLKKPLCLLRHYRHATDCHTQQTQATPRLRARSFDTRLAGVLYVQPTNISGLLIIDYN